MSSLYKINGIYYLNYIDTDGKRLRKTLKTRRKLVAIQRKIKIDKTLRANCEEEEDIDEPFYEIVARFSQHLGSTTTPTHTQHQIPRLEKFLNICNIDEVDKITPSKIQGYLDKLVYEDHYQPNTVRGYKYAISRFCRFLMLEGLLPSNPAQATRTMPIGDPQERYLTQEQADIVLDKAKELNIFGEVLCGLHTGLRRSELASLTWENVHLEKKLVLVRGKGNKVRTVPMSDMLHNYFLIIRRNSGLVFRRRSEHSWQKEVKKIADSVSFEFRGWHDLRHTFASRLAQSGKVSLYEIQQYLGHSSPFVTQRYARLIPDKYNHDINAGLTNQQTM